MNPQTQTNSGHAAAPAESRPPIRVEGAKVHNLRNISLDIPRNKLVVITGLSGSGKSSLALDTIFAEGQRQYIESLSVYPRRYLHQMERPEVDLVRGLQPTISIDQRGRPNNPRSTVATITEVYDYMRLLYARLGDAHCYRCGRVIRPQTPEEILEEILRFPANTRVMILAPLARGKKGRHKDTMRKIAKSGFVRARVDGVLMDLESFEELDPNKRHDIEAVVDRVVIKDGIASRLGESLKLALGLGEGTVVCVYEKERLSNPDGTTKSIWKDVLFSSLHSCPKCKINFSEIEPRTFSFNSPYGICPECHGLGCLEAFDPEAVFPDPILSLKNGAIAPWKNLSNVAQRFIKAHLDRFFGKLLREGNAPEIPVKNAAKSADTKRDEPKSAGRAKDAKTAKDALEKQIEMLYKVPLCQFSDEVKKILYFGEHYKLGLMTAQFLKTRIPESESADREADRENDDSRDGFSKEEEEEKEGNNGAMPQGASQLTSGRSPEHKPDEVFPGVLPLLEQVYETIRNKREKEAFHPYRRACVCDECGGSRLRAEARSVTVGKRRIFELCALTIGEALDFFRRLEFPESKKQIAQPIVQQIVQRLDFMNRIGLDYLGLDRAAKTLSGGELQRVRLATGLGSGLVGVCYVLDEPSIGLHPRDNRRLIDAMRLLQNQGNSVLVVEHDEAIMREADWLIDIGPGAGRQGGRVMAQGRPEEISGVPESITGRFLSGAESIPVPKKRRKGLKAKSLVLEGVTTNNLKNVTVSFPLETLICVTGVSGSGKSSLLNETLVPAVMRRLTGHGPLPGPHRSLRGTAKIDKLVQIDQTPIGRSPRSNPATYSGVFDEIRKVFATTKAARHYGYKSGRFSFNIPGGRCEECQGQGVRKIEMHFLPDLYAVCPMCGGKRFNRQTLAVTYKDKSIADVLDMPIDEAAEFFGHYPVITRQLESFQRVGLGYLTLGQSATTLSGGEAQRIKLAVELARVETGDTLYVLDEPTSGLHSHDIRQLLNVLSELVEHGNTVVVIEHNLDVMKTADWMIDLGPEGGQRGGEVTACGTPEEIAKLENNSTGRFLKTALKTAPKRDATQAKKRESEH